MGKVVLFLGEGQDRGWHDQPVQNGNEGSTIIKNLKTATAEHETKCGALRDFTGCPLMETILGGGEIRRGKWKKKKKAGRSEGERSREQKGRERKKSRTGAPQPDSVTPRSVMFLESSASRYWTKFCLPYANESSRQPLN